VPDSKPMQYRIVDRSKADRGDERARVLAALMEEPARIEPKYFYDDLGCALYGAICRLPEYYPTRTEMGIFREARGEIAAALGSGHQFVDLGAGDCCKGEAWLPFLAPRRYVAVDIALPELERSLARIAPDFPEIEMVGLVADFAAGLPLDEVLDATPATFFYPGSSIGNFTPEESVAFLARVRAFCAARPGSNLLIGVDGKKATPVLDAAYDDALGVTAAFNRNVLLHLNRRFGLEFALDGFRHCGFYNPAMGRIEMHLESLRDQWIWLGEHERHFPRGARIHTENSYKYLPAEFESVLRAAGFIDTRRWASADGGYFVFLAS
jgi:L-histidine N-alpha-methyltransferase